MNATITYNEFLKDYVAIKKEQPDYRLGQHFINLFIKDESDSVLNELWDKDGEEAISQILEVIFKYQWDFNALVVVQRNTIFLSEKGFDTLKEVLDNPPTEATPALKDLMSRKRLSVKGE